MDPQKKFFLLAKNYSIKKSDLPSNFLRILKNGILMGYLEKDGATERAGIKPGDILLSMNGNVLKMEKKGTRGEYLTVESLKFLRSHGIGEKVNYRVLRNNEIIDITVTMSNFGINLILILLFICSVPLFSLGIFYSLLRPVNNSARLTGLVFIMIGFQLAMSLDLYAPDYDAFAFLKIYLSNIIVLLFIPVLIHSLFLFPKPNSSLIKKKIYIFLPYILGSAGIILFSYWYFTDYTAIKSRIFDIIAYSMIAYFIVVRIAKRKYDTPIYKKIITITNLIWLFIFLVFNLSNIFSFFGLSILPLWFREYSFMIILLCPVMYFIFTWKYSLFDIKIKIKRSLQYSVFSNIYKLVLFLAFLGIAYIISKIEIQFPNIRLTSANIEFLSVPLDADNNALYNKLLFMFLVFVMALMFIRFGGKGLKLIDKKFYRQKFDYKKVQMELAAILNKKFTLESLSKSFIERVISILNLKRAGIIFFKDLENTKNTGVYCFDSQNNNDFCFQDNPEMINEIKNLKVSISTDGFKSDLKKYFSENKFYYITPIRTDEKFLGALFTGEKLSETMYNNEDIEVLNSMTAAASVAVENALLYEEVTKQERIKNELEIAHKIQLGSLPQKLPNIKGLDISAISLPALEVGGDFYDFLNGTLDDLTIVVGDVSGKGTSAALYMSKVQGIMQTLYEFDLSPSKLLSGANRLLYGRIDSKSYITAISAKFNNIEKTLTIARAGHLPLFYYCKSSDKVSKIQPGGIGLGLGAENVFNENIEERIIKYDDGDIFLFVSDGITESMNKSGEQYGDNRLISTLTSYSGKSSQIITNSIISSVRIFSEGMNQFDDMTIVVVKMV
jgi:serine phosphatase RsbU (regulator of sigma subunit)